MWLAVEVASYATVVVGYGLLLLLAVRHRLGRDRAQRLLEVALLLAALWTLGLGLLALLVPGRMGGFIWHRTAQIGLVFLALLTAEFADAFVQRADRRWPRLAISLLLTVAALVLDFIPLPVPSYVIPWFLVTIGRTEFSTLLLVAAWAVPMSAAWSTGAVALRRARGAKHRNRIRYLLASLLSFSAGDLLLFIGGIPDVYVGLSARLLGFSIFTFALLRYDLPDLRRFSLATIRIVLLSGLTAGLYLVALFVASLVSGALFDLSYPLLVAISVGLALLVAAVVDVTLRPRLRRFFDRTVLGQTYDVQKALRAYSQQINLILDLERLADMTLDWLRTTLRIKQAAFILFTSNSQGQTELRVLRAAMYPLPTPHLFSADSRFILHFKNFARPLSQYDLDMLAWFQAMAAADRQWLKELAVDFYVPVLVADTPVALLALGPKNGGQPYSDEDLETLMILAGQTGTALENARLLDDLRAVQGDLHRLSTELAETNRQLQRLDQTKADFVTIASHELRTPLSQIFGYSDVLSSLEGDELGNSQVVNEFIKGISRGARRLKRVVDAMVDMSLIDTGGLRIHTVLVPLSVVVQNAVESFRLAAKERDLTLSIDNLSDLPYIQADGARLEQVFTSLLSNAIKFTPDGREIVVSGQVFGPSPGEEYIEVLVSDQGIGIDSDQLDLIFEKFYRPENPLLHSTDDVGFKGAGPGLGLAIAKGIVEAHGGRIWAESPGRDEKTFPGSTFHVLLPVAAEPKG